MAFVRLIVFGFLILGVIYICLAFYSQSVRRERLEKRWAKEQPDGVTQDEYVDKGMVEYHASFRPKLLWLVFIVPSIALGTYVYLSN